MKIGIFISGSGTNMEEIIQNFNSGYFSNIDEISFVFSDKKKAKGLAIAQGYNVRTLVLPKKKGELREEYTNRIQELIKEFDVDILVLAGFLKILPGSFIKKFGGKIINIHPSLLPAFPGLDAQKQAFEYGVKVSGASVHFVDDSLDGGPVVLQSSVERQESDSFETFKSRILEREHVIFSKALEIVSTNSYKIVERHVVILNKGEQ